MRKNIRKLLLVSFVLAFQSFLFSEAVSSMQLYKADSWIYKSMERLGTESGVLPVTFNAPITAGELRLYFSEIDRDLLSESGQELYDLVEDFLYEKPKTFGYEDFFIAPNLKVTPEFYVKTNPEIDWTYDYYYKDNFISADILLGYSDYVLFESEPFLGKNYFAMHKPYNFTNIILGVGDTEFQQPRWSNFSTGYNFPNWGFNIVIGKEGLQVGQSLMGSIAYNNTFMTDMFAQLNIYSKIFKVSQTVVEISKNKFYYNHQIEALLLKKLRLAIGEGVVVTNSFEPRFLIPLMPYHSYAAWHDYSPAETEYYSESNFCNYLNILLEFAPIPSTRFYIYYAMNELQLPWENSQTPNSMGWQFGSESSFNAPGNGFWNLGVEAIWTLPYLYIKHGAPWSLYREYKPNHDSDSGDSVRTWIGTPYGPDCMGGAIKFGYEKPQKWSADFMWIFTAHGDNGFGMLRETITDEDGNEWYYYYPAVKYDHAENEAEKQAALDDALNWFPSGVIEYKNQAVLQGSYNFNKHFSLNGQIVYIFAFNHNNREGNFQQGAEFTISGTYSLF